jgi:DNA repair protein RecN (Recombination protein N)
MLHSLHINNIALIKNLTIDFTIGLNILTGETGAGKSIIIDSLNFLLGARADKTLIKSGEAQSKVTGVFLVDSKKQFVKEFFEKLDIPLESEVIITRQMGLNKKSTTKVNGEFVTASMLKAFTPHLIDIHGQNEHQFLLDNTNQLTIIDNFGAKELRSYKQNYFKQFELLKEINFKIKALGGSEEDRTRQMDLLNYQINELEGAKLDAQEEIDLKERLKLMQNSEKLTKAVSDAHLNFESSLEGNMIGKISSAITSLRSVEGLDTEIAKLTSRLDSIKLELDDATSELALLQNNYSFDEAEFERVDERIDYIKKLKRKYGSHEASIKSTLAYLEKAKERLFALESSYEALNKFKKQKRDVLISLLISCTQLSEKRQAVARSLSGLIVSELCELGMKDAKLEVSFKFLPTLEELEDVITTGGVDVVEFMFSANLGEPVKALNKIISGGEMSRFMLAIKTITSKTDNIDTMVFDEIDSGISGKMAQAVSKKMAKISKNHQVLVVSHLPQIAAMADTHFYIEKTSNNFTTNTNVKQIDGESIVKEIARMLSGDVLTANSINNAKELKEVSNNYKNSL